ncbi:hypothetical protein RGQ29_001562 [Quercus rubra]|uniref:Uncharacterized protein n=1 Tax=Quercus rubra TaxID=3512 RepID=A0AAN7G657_QUERU|nr:hypothetical protein RGQ29_001562 [Quercus rubra]
MQSYHYNRLMSKSSRCYSATANRVLFWLVVALKNRGKFTVDCLSGIISLLVVLELEFVMIYASLNLLHSCQGVDFKIKLLTIGGKRLKAYN